MGKKISEREKGKKGVEGEESERTGGNDKHRMTHIWSSSRIVAQCYTTTKWLKVTLIDVICWRVQLILIGIHTTAVFEAAVQVCILWSVSGGRRRIPIIFGRSISIRIGSIIPIGRNRPRSNGGHTFTDGQSDKHDMVCDCEL